MPQTSPASTVRNSLETRASAIFGWISSVTRSSFHPIAAAIIAIDSVRPTWRTVCCCTLLGELLAREAGPDLLLEGQPPDARVLDAVDGDPVHALADAGQGDRQARP